MEALEEVVLSRESTGEIRIGDVLPEDPTMEGLLAVAEPSAPAAPGWCPPALAAVAAAGTWIAPLLAPETLLVGLLACVLGAGVGRWAGRWPSGGLLAAGAWAIGAFGAGALSGGATALWADAGLLGIAIGASRARGDEEVPEAYWVAPARLIALVGAVHAGVWLPTAIFGASAPAIACQAATVATAAAVAVGTRPHQQLGTRIAAAAAPLAVGLVWLGASEIALDQIALGDAPDAIALALAALVGASAAAIRSLR